MKLSVVIIIYKVERYLRQCIESVLAQTYTDFELILVDDGSPDNCPQICDEFAKSDSRIMVIHQENQGPVMARWNGISVALGDYISVIDGDDWIDSDMYERTLQLAYSNNADIVATGYKEEKDGNYTPKGNQIESGIYSGESMKYLLSKALFLGTYYIPGIIPSVACKIFRRNLFFTAYEHPHPSIRMGDDAAVSYPLIARAKTVVIANEIHSYNYRMVENSLSHKMDPLYFDRCLELLKGLAGDLRNIPEMLEDLKYYSLFLIEIGVFQLNSRKSGYTIIEQKRILDRFYREYRAIGISMNYNWGLIPKKKKWLKNLMGGGTLLAIFKLYRYKFYSKIERQFHITHLASHKG